MIEVEVVHPAGHTQQYFTHDRDVGEVVRIDRHLGIDTVRQGIDFSVRAQLDDGLHAIRARRDRQRLERTLRLIGPPGTTGRIAVSFPENTWPGRALNTTSASSPGFRRSSEFWRNWATI